MRKGFSLIEIIVVLAIIGILTTLAVAGYQKSELQSRDQKRKADLGLVQTALESYKSENDSYPANNISYKGLCNVLVPNYIQSLPFDPKNSNPCITAGSGGYTYTSCNQTTCNTYTLSATLESTNQSYTINQNGEVLQP